MKIYKNNLLFEIKFSSSANEIWATDPIIFIEKYIFFVIKYTSEFARFNFCVGIFFLAHVWNNLSSTN